MKKHWMIGALAIPAALAGAQAQAQSKVEIYGLISGGVGYLTNQGGPHNFEALSGTNQNPRIGFRGQEDLGGGTRAIFTLENGFNMMTGAASQSGRLFGRQSWVGLASNSMGTVTLGRQYEAVKDYLGPVVIASNGVHIGDNDNGYNNLRVQNSVKYVSPMFNDFNVTALYGFGEAAGDASVNRVMSIGSGYKGGNFRWAVAFTQMDQPNSTKSPDGAMGNDYASSLLIFNKSAVNSSAGVRRQRIAGTGGFYTVGKTDFGAMYSNVKYEYLDNTKLTLQNFDINLVHHYTPALNLGASYFYTTGNGQKELVEALLGQRRHLLGEIRIEDAPYAATREEMRRLRVFALPEEPLRNACIAGMSVAENMALRNFDVAPFKRSGWRVDRSAMKRQAQSLIATFNVKPPAPERPIGTLSGGNVQRAVLARELGEEGDAGAANVLIVANPVFGLDFASVADIHARLLQARARGAAVLLVSEDLDELLELSDRILVMTEGRIVHVAQDVATQGADRAALGRWMAGHSEQSTHAEAA